MPERVDFNALMDHVTTNVNIPIRREDHLYQYKAVCTSNLSEAIVKDAFWLVLSRCFKSERKFDIEGKLYSRLSENYTKLFEETDSELKDLVFLRYSDMLAQAVYFGMYTAYPNSRCELSQEFRHRIMDITCYWTTGLQCPLYDDHHWKMVPSMITKKERGKIEKQNLTKRFNLPLSNKSLEDQLNKKLDNIDKMMKSQLLNGNNNNNNIEDSTILQSSRNINPSSPTNNSISSPTVSATAAAGAKFMKEVAEYGKVKSFYVGKCKPATRGFIALSHSELVDRHLQKFGERVLSTQHAFPIKITEFPRREDGELIGEKSDTIDEENHIETYQDIVHKTKHLRREIYKEYEKKKKQTNKEVRSIENSHRRDIEHIKSEAKKVKDIHEFSNYLVSQWSLKSMKNNQ